jgi:hypothetical protein
MFSNEVLKLLRSVLCFLFLNAAFLVWGQASDGQRRFVVALPQQWQESKLRVAVDGLQAPGNVPFKLRVFAMSEGEKEVSLGSVGVEAIAPDKIEPRTLKTLRLDVTRSLNRFLENKRDATKIELLLQPVDARNNPIKDLEWSVKDVRLEAEAK